MIISITEFPLPAGATLDQIAASFIEVAPKFTDPPGLVRKYFVVSDERNTGGGIYVWNDKDSAVAFNENVVGPMVREHFGDPTIRYFDVPVISDSERGVVIPEKT